MQPLTQHIDTARRSRLIKSASYASIAVALSLVLLKGWAWRATGSISLLASLADSMLDVVASGLTFWAVRYSLAPADSEHRFGHGKSEGLAALVQSGIIAASGAYVCSEALQRLLKPAAIRAPEAGIGVIVVATVATGLLVVYQLFVARRAGSIAIRADAMHYKTDIAVNLGVALAIALASWTRWQIIDPLVGLLVAAYVLWSAFGILKQSLDVLLDREIPDKEREKIRRIALGHAEVHGLHDMKTRFGGSNYIIQFHLELKPEITLWRSHEILDDVEAAIQREYPGADIIIHPDPLGFPETVEHFD